jgi:hypothetical protein
MPAFNEQDVIGDTIEAALAILGEFVERFEVIVVDDGSRDRTAEVIAGYAKSDPRVRLIRHATNKGYGSAVTSGLRAARGDFVAFTDSDGQFSFLDLAHLLIRKPGCDVVVGYRYKRADHWVRRVNAWGWTRLINLLLGVRVRDLDCAFKLFPRQVIDELELTSTGAAINAQIMAQCMRGQLKIRQTPVRHYPRYSGVPTGAARQVIMRAFCELPPLLHYRTAPIHFPVLHAACLEAGSAGLLAATNGFYSNGVGAHLTSNGHAVNGKNGHNGQNGHGMPNWLSKRIASGALESPPLVSDHAAGNGHAHTAILPQ